MDEDNMQNNANEKMNKKVSEGNSVNPKVNEENSDKSKLKEEELGNKKDNKEKSLMVVIRISGMVKVNKDIESTLSKLRLRRKYSCIIIAPRKETLGMINKVKFHTAFGEIDKEILIKLLKERGKTVDKNDKSEMDFEKTADELLGGKKLEDLGLKPFFRLHPPRKGIKSKLQYPKGVLGNNKKDINKLIDRML